MRDITRALGHLIDMDEAKFELGTILATSGASSAFTGSTIVACLSCHVSGDWGTASPKDAAANDAALRDGERILSAYVRHGKKLWVITEADRSVTTVLLPEEH